MRTTEPRELPLPVLPHSDAPARWAKGFQPQTHFMADPPATRVINLTGHNS